MSTLAKYWKIVLALLLAVAALLVVLMVYLPGKTSYETRKTALNSDITTCLLYTSPSPRDCS